MRWGFSQHAITFWNLGVWTCGPREVSQRAPSHLHTVQEDTARATFVHSNKKHHDVCTVGVGPKGTHYLTGSSPHLHKVQRSCKQCSKGGINKKVQKVRVCKIAGNKLKSMYTRKHLNESRLTHTRPHPHYTQAYTCTQLLSPHPKEKQNRAHIGRQRTCERIVGKSTPSPAPAPTTSCCCGGRCCCGC